MWFIYVGISINDNEQLHNFYISIIRNDIVGIYAILSIGKNKFFNFLIYLHMNKFILKYLKSLNILQNEINYIHL